MNEKEKIMLAALEGIAKFAGVQYTILRDAVVVKISSDLALISGMCAKVGLEMKYVVRNCDGERLYFLHIKPLK